LEYAKKLGDLSENAEYHQAREEQAEVEDRIGRLENILKNAVITKTHSADVVSIGSSVKLDRDGSTQSLEYTIVGSEEADMSKGKISNLSPLGSVLIGHRKGDIVKVSAPKGTISYTISNIK
jgi:transcription elongation factor GreA